MAEVSPERAQELVRDGRELIDVRSPDEHEAGHIAGDRSIPFDRLREEAEQLPKDQPVVVYCRSGDRSGAAAEALRASGYDAYSIEGGLLRWQEQGLPVEGEVIERSTTPPA